MAVGITAVVCLLLLLSSVRRAFDHDEFEAIHSAWKMLDGETIYVDFFQHHHPLFYFTLAGVIAATGTGTATVLACRLLVLGMTAGILLLTHQIARRAHGRAVAGLSVALLGTSVIFFEKAIEVRPDVPQALAGLGAVNFLLSYFERRRPARLVLSAFCLVLSLLFLQKAVFLTVFVAVFLASRIWTRAIRPGWVALYWAVFLLGLALFVAVLLLYVPWSEYVFLNWTLNAQLRGHFTPLKYLLSSLAENPLVWAGYLGGLVFLAKTRAAGPLAWLSVWLLSTVFVAGAPFRQYYLLAMPFVCIVAASGLARLSERDGWGGWRGPALLALGAVYPTLVLGRGIVTGNAEQQRKIQYVLEVTEPGDFVYDGRIQFNLFRKDIDYFWFSLRPNAGALAAYRMLRGYDYDPYERIRALEPMVVSGFLLDTGDPAVASSYVRSSRYPDLYLRSGGTARCDDAQARRAARLLCPPPRPPGPW